MRQRIVRVLNKNFKYIIGLALAVVVGGTSVATVMASIPDSSGVIHGCLKSTGMLSVIDSASQTCPANTTSLNWNQTGPQGTTGPQGPQGPAGPAGGAVGYAYLVPSGNAQGIDPTFSSNVSILATNLPTGGEIGQVVCIKVNTTNPLNGLVNSEPNPGTGDSFRYSVAGYPGFDSFESDVDTPACPSGTNVKIFENQAITANFLFY